MKQETKYLGVIGLILIVAVAVLVFPKFVEKPLGLQDNNGLKTFSSLDDLKAYVSSTATENSNSYMMKGGSGQVFAESVTAPTAMDSSSRSASSNEVSSGASSYSTTNNQVEGVDEPDIVKNDGKYIYTVNGKSVSITEAFPADEMRVLKTLNFSDYVSNIFLNGNKLIVFMNHYEYFETGGCVGPMYASEIGIRMPCYGGYSKEETKIVVYDVNDKQNPEVDKEFTVSGNYVDARMIGDFVYLISSKYITLNHFELPYYYSGSEKFSVDPVEISYFDYSDNSYVFNSVSAINLDSNEITTKVFMLGSSNTLYVSENNIYLVMPKELGQKERLNGYVKEVILKTLPSSEAGKVQDILNSNDKLYKKSRDIGNIVEDYVSSLEGADLTDFMTSFSEKNDAYYKQLNEEMDKSVVHKVSLDGTNIEYVGSGEVKGRPLNQFSMDEFEAKFRITTTSGQTWNGKSENNLYVLDEDLNVVGSVEGLAEGERIYSTRFVGDRAYVVTFKQVDPLFVIDLSDSASPKVLGYLKVTGYSDYLHPYDETHLIGVGMDATAQGRTQGVKVALFDVSDVEHPTQVGKYEITEGRWSSTDVSYDHKAFLFDKEKGIIVMPVSYYDNNKNWQGAYVFKVNLAEGVKLKGKIAHEMPDTNSDYTYGPQTDYVRRSLFMDDVLYTVSNYQIKASSLGDLSEIKKVVLPFDQPIYRIMDYGGVSTVSAPSAVE
jgi:inhibitor of cysteine peptidase